MSYTQTCEIPGITIAGADSQSMKYTPPADAEYLHYGYCKTIDNIPMTPDGKPTPALLTKTALESASIPAENIKNPSKIVPKATMLGTMISTCIYILGTVVLFGIFSANLKFECFSV